MGEGGLGTWNILESKSHFPILEGLFIYLSSFAESSNFFQRLLMFSSCIDLLGTFWLILRCATSSWVLWHLEM